MASWDEQVKIVASDGASNDRFGWNVDIDGDYIIVGAYEDSTPTLTKAGSAYIYKKGLDENGDETWTQQSKLTASDPVASDKFGESVAISGNYAICGVPFDDDKGDNSGTAYIFKKGTDENGDETWTQQIKLNSSDAIWDDEFGNSVDIYENYIVVGAHLDNTSRGAAYIFKKGNSGAPSVNTVKVVDNGGNLYEVNGQETPILTLVKGNTYRFNQDDSSNSGHPLKLYDDANKTTEYTTGVTVSGTAGTDRYLEITVASDAPSSLHYQCTEHSGMGAQINIVDDDETWTQQIKLVASDLATNAKFGTSVEIDGDYIIIGAVGANKSYIFKKGLDENGDETWTEQAKLIPSNGVSDDNFGFSVSIHGNYAICGAPYRDNPLNSGAAYIFKKDDGAETWTQQAHVTSDTAAEWDVFGYAVSIYGNYAVIGVPFDDDPTSSGSIFIFKKGLDENGDETWTKLEKITASDQADSDSLGFHVAMDGNYAVISAYGENSKQGASYVFKLTGDNNAPISNSLPTGIDKTITINQDTSYTFTANDISGNDVNGDDIGKFKITQLPAKGTFEVSGNAITLNQEILAADVTNITYLPVSEEIGNDYVTILYKPHDGTDYAENHATITFHVTQDQNQIEALNSGLSSSNTDKIKNTTISQNGAETNVFADKFIKNVSQRHSAIKLLFSKNASITKTKISRKDLKLTPNIKKEKVMVHKPKTTETVGAAAALVVNDEVDTDTGIYANLADVGDAIKFKAHSGATDVVFTKTATGYTASTSGDTVWQPGDRYTFENVSYYFD